MVANPENYLTQAAADARYQAQGSLGSDAPDTIQPDDTGSAGASTSASRADHQHGIVTATPSSITTANFEGTATSFARSDHLHAYLPPCCRVYNNANISVANNSSVLVTFNSERYDTNTMHDTATNNSRITFNVAGVYLVGFNGKFQWDTDYGHTEASIRLNGTTLIVTGGGLGISTGGFEQILQPVTTYKFAAGDYIEVLVFQQNGSGNAQNLLVLGNVSPEFWATWIGNG